MNLNDNLLEVLDRLTTKLRWRGSRSLQTTAEVLTDAVEDWVAQHAVEFNRSEPFASVPTTSDVLAAALRNLIEAVHVLSTSRARPELDLSTALTEALDEWLSSTPLSTGFEQDS